MYFYVLTYKVHVKNFCKAILLMDTVQNVENTPKLSFSSESTHFSFTFYFYISFLFTTKIPFRKEGGIKCTNSPVF